MASTIKVDEIKSQANGSAISIASGGNVTNNGTFTSTGAITASGGIADAGTISAGTLGSAVVVPQAQLVHLETVTLTSQEVGAFEGKLTSTYNTYLLIGNKIKPETDNKRLVLQFGVGSAGSVTYRTTEYYTQAQKIETGSWGSVINESNQAQTVVGGFGNQGNATNEFSYFQTYLFNTQESGVRSMGSISAGGYKTNAEFIYTVGGFVNTLVEAHTSVRVKFDSSTVGQGIFSLYGIKNG